MKRFLFAGLMLASTVSAFAAEWSLKPVEGDVAHKWKQGIPNWTWDQKNPCSDNGVVWTLFHQDKLDSEKSGPFLPMKPGVAYNYTWVWVGQTDGKNPTAFYTSGKKLIAPPRTSQEKNGIGKAVGILFKPNAEGKYEIDISGKVSVSAPTAGHARVQIYTLDTSDQTVSLLKEANLNSPKGFRNYPSELKWKGEVVFGKNTVFVLRIQSVNPGYASCGGSTLAFEYFRVKSK